MGPYESANTTISTGKTKKFGACEPRGRCLSGWFPFANAHVVLNGREWLAKQMDAKGIDYVREDNCFGFEYLARAQELANPQIRMDWVGQLESASRTVGIRSMPGSSPTPPKSTIYWTSETKPNGLQRGVPRSRRLGSPVPTVGCVMASIRSDQSRHPQLLQKYCRPVKAVPRNFATVSPRAASDGYRRQLGIQTSASGKTP